MQAIEARGTPREIGFAVGANMQTLVLDAIDLVCRFTIPCTDWRRRLERITRTLERTFPHVLDEAEGLAAGAGVAPEDVLALSVCTDLDGRLPAWCSLVSAPSREGILLGRNLDVPPGMEGLQVLERIEREGHLAFVHLTTAGAMWTDGGMNEAGLALVNASVLAREPNPNGVPDGILVREILATCPDVPAAIDMAAAYDVMTLGENLLLGDATGRVAVIEKLPRGQAVLEGRCLAVCNHATAPELVGLMSRSDPIRANSERRLDELTKRLTEATSGDHGRESVKEVVDFLAGLLRSHAGDVCQHGAAGLWTAVSLIVAPKTQDMWVAAGSPCAVPFTQVVRRGALEASCPADEAVEGADRTTRSARSDGEGL